MRHRRLRRLTKPQIFGILMLTSLSLLFVPSRFLRPVKNLTQLVALPQWLARESAQKVTQQVHDLGQDLVSAPTHDQVLREKQALERENVSLHQQISELQATVDAIGQIRNAKRFPKNGILIPARVMAWDGATGRDSMLISNDKAKKGNWVASRILIDAGAQEGIQNQLVVLGSQCLIGWVEDTGPFAARVVLLTDPIANKATRVRIHGKEDPYPEIMVDGKTVDFTLKGDGPNRMKIPDVPRDFVENGKIRVGDWVMSNPNDPKLPIPVAIGQIAELPRVKEKPVYYQAIVQPACDVKSLREVFVVDLSESNHQKNSSTKNR